MKKSRIKIKLAIWQLDLIDTLAANRSQYFRDLFLEMLKKQNIPIAASLDHLCFSPQEIQTISEKLKKTWGKEYKCQKVRRIGKKFSQKLPEYLKKVGITVFLDSWMLQIVERVEPNRTLFFSTLLLCKIETELSKSGLIEEDTVISKCHGDLYIRYLKEQAGLRSNSL
ncbi:hypothetical protein AB1K84_00500 [Mesobacillus foraminis]|uniref:hypothetical protein n=1 Tax=Mesobacillus foraminis TaxID=279826 RepID=UPI00399F0A5C